MPLEPGVRIGRIRIDALLGAGGMGEVYRGWDEKLERAVALKVVHGEYRVDASIRTRFLREARVLSQLDHPNICRIYDVLERDDGDYLVLELVEGTTLRARMEQGLTRAEALDVALQVARVLAVTHARGIVHRDLKPDNIMLTPSGQVKVLDFGLARPVAALQTPVEIELDENADTERTAVLGRPSVTTETSHTVAGSLVGTLHYMSPEQARGLPITEASDIYSLGVVLFELLARRSAYGPVESMPDLLSLVRRGEIAPFDFRDRAVSALLRRMLALHPANRADAATVVRELEAIRERPSRVRQRVLASAALVCIIALIAGAFLLSRHASARLLAKPHGRVAILPFRNATGDASLQWMERGLAELVVEGTRRARGADLVPVDDVTRAMKDLRIDARRELTDAQQRSLFTALGADVLVEPVVTADEGKYTISYSMLTPEGAEVSQEATSTVLTEAARQMSTDLAQRIDPASVAAVRAQTSVDNLANMLYAIGMQELRTRGPRVAANYFAVCVDRDPEFLAAKLQLADALKAMTENARAAKLLDEVIARARTRNDRYMVARALVIRASWASDDGNYALAEGASREALAIGQALGDQDLVGRAWGTLGHASWRLGRLDDAKQYFERGLKIFVDLRSPRDQAQFHNNLGVLADSREDIRESEPQFRAAMAIAERANDRYLLATIVGNLAGVYAEKGQLVQAEEMTRRQIAITREIGDTASEVFGLVNLGIYLWAQGKESEAVAVTRDAASVAAKVGNVRVETVILANLAVAETKLGDLAAARQHADAAAAKGATIDDPEVDREVDLANAYTLIREGRLDEAERAIRDAEQWQVNARCVLMRGRLAYARGDYARAYALLRQSKSMGELWHLQNEQMYRAFEESARTGRPAQAKFEEPPRS